VPWNLGIVTERSVAPPPAAPLPSFTDFTNLSALPTGWSQVSGGTPQFFSDGMGSSTGALEVMKSTVFSDFASNGGGYMYLHLKRGSATGGTATQFGRYITNPTVTENLTGVPGYGATSAWGIPVYGQGFFRNDTIPATEQTTRISSPVSTGIRDLWVAGLRTSAGTSRFFVGNGVSGVFQVLTGGTGGLAPVTQERVQILSGGTDIRICQTYMAFGTRTFAEMIQDWQLFMGYP